MKTTEEQELELATEFVLANPRAQEFVWWVLAQCGVYNAKPIVNGETGIDIGRRLIGLTIINQINSINPVAYAQMMIDAHGRAETRKIIEDAQTTDE